MKRVISVMLMLVIMMSLGCRSQDVSPGHKGFMMDKTGAGALWMSGGKGLTTNKILGAGTYWVGAYDDIIGVNCKDQDIVETLKVTTKSNMKIKVDIRMTYSANCSNAEYLKDIITKNPPTLPALWIQPSTLFSVYIRPFARQSIRNYLSKITIQEIQEKRSGISVAIQKDMKKVESKFPVLIKVVAVSSITLPVSVDRKIKEIELSRMQANNEKEKQKASKVRLLRELFEAEQDLKVKEVNADKLRKVALIQAEAQASIVKMKAKANFLSKEFEAKGVKLMRTQLTDNYLKYLQVLKDSEVRLEAAKSMGRTQSTVYYMNGMDFIIPPGSKTGISVNR